ncbi:hypothetical protein RCSIMONEHASTD_13 [Rhodobacter phage RcSimone-Hastad]|nr:hypothetical protein RCSIMONEHASTD_13 [Rhodobacter phage RcSimone-Hastad]
MIQRETYFKGNPVSRFKVYGHKLEPGKWWTVYKAPIQCHPMKHSVSHAPV